MRAPFIGTDGAITVRVASWLTRRSVDCHSTLHTCNHRSAAGRREERARAETNV